MLSPALLKVSLNRRFVFFVSLCSDLCSLSFPEARHPFHKTRWVWKHRVNANWPELWSGEDGRGERRKKLGAASAFENFSPVLWFLDIICNRKGCQKWPQHFVISFSYPWSELSENDIPIQKSDSFIPATHDGRSGTGWFQQRQKWVYDFIASNRHVSFLGRSSGSIIVDSFELANASPSRRASIASSAIQLDKKARKLSNAVSEYASRQMIRVCFHPSLVGW